MNYYIISLLLALVSNSIATSEPTAETENGPVTGTYATSLNGGRYKAFMGIPYAKPPTGDNRFKPPQRLEGRWIGVWNAKKPGSGCMQIDHFQREVSANGSVKYHVRGDEDCLYLNVFTSVEGPESKNVLVHFHGGAFMFGDGANYGPRYIMDRDDIVLVSVNYRLGPLGFASTGDGVIPGNFGLKDQNAALQWVQRNIAKFGGNPNKVTISGNSAGGASVTYHFLSPMSEGLFQRGIAFSGTAWCPWAFLENVPERTKTLATLLGCPTTDSKTILKCLKKRPAMQIVENLRHFYTWLYNPFAIFGPVAEKGYDHAFLNDTPANLFREGKMKDLPIIFGLTPDEGLYGGAEKLKVTTVKDAGNVRATATRNETIRVNTSTYSIPSFRHQVLFVSIL